jgi:GntR family transcriptional regulator
MHTGTHALAALRIEASGVPIYVQLREQFLRLIGAGTLGPGAQLPTMRQVAVALRIDLNTVRHAYEELERFGAVVLVRGRGSFVAESPPRIDEPPDEPNELDALARQSVAAAAARGVDPLALSQRIATLVAEKEDIR